MNTLSFTVVKISERESACAICRSPGIRLDLYWMMRKVIVSIYSTTKSFCLGHFDNLMGNLVSRYSLSIHNEIKYGNKSANTAVVVLWNTSPHSFPIIS